MWTVVVAGIVLMVIIVLVLGVCILLMRAFSVEVGRVTQTQANITRDMVRDISGVVRDAVTTTTASVVEGTLGVIVGKPDTPVAQPTLEPANDPFSPEWMKWPDQANLDDPTQFGIGDIEMMDRQHEGATYLAPGESMIPGIPLPNMSAENYDGE